MSSHTISAAKRLEVVETGRRRRWSDDEKIRIVLESMAGPRQVSATARRHGVSRSLLFTWRRTFLLERSAEAPGFVPALVAPEPSAAQPDKGARASADSADGRIEIILARGRRVLVDADVDPEALGRIVAVLERG